MTSRTAALLTVSLHLADKEGCFRPSSDEKLLFRKRIPETSKIIVGSSYHLLIFSNSSCQ
jgi:hypothetical protein